MNYVIHLTRNCNLNCTYCYEEKSNCSIDFENIKRLIDNEIRMNSDTVLLTFFGGEPLIRKDLIYQTIEYIKEKKCKTEFTFGMTTNGILLDDKMIKCIANNKFMHIGYSIDGTSDIQNLNRITVDNKETAEIVEENAKKILKKKKEVIAMMVITKNNINGLIESIEHLIKLGFRKFNLQFNYLDNWTDEDLKIIKKQYALVADLYYNKLVNKDEIEIYIFDEKIRTHIYKTYNCNKDCKFGYNSINVGTDGNFYSCMQFVYNEKYKIGNCISGIDYKKRDELQKTANKEKEVCKKCLVRTRCKHTCPCVNYMTTKDINGLSPIVCELEKIIINEADRIANMLYKNNSKILTKKYYKIKN